MEGLVLLLILLACPLMMVFMMRGHGPGGHAHGAHAHGATDALDDGRCRCKNDPGEAAS